MHIKKGSSGYSDIYDLIFPEGRICQLLFVNTPIKVGCSSPAELSKIKAVNQKNRTSFSDCFTARNLWSSNKRNHAKLWVNTAQTRNCPIRLFYPSVYVYMHVTLSVCSSHRQCEGQRSETDTSMWLSWCPNESCPHTLCVIGCGLNTQLLKGWRPEAFQTKLNKIREK